jgi:hypothetical protein
MGLLTKHLAQKDKRDEKKRPGLLTQHLQRQSEAARIKTVRDKIQAGKTPSRRDTDALGVELNRKQRKILADTVRRKQEQPGLLTQHLLKQRAPSTGALVGQEVEAARGVAADIQTETAPTQPTLKRRGLLSPMLQLPGGVAQTFARDITEGSRLEDFKQELRAVRRGSGTEEEKTAATTEIVKGRINERVDSIQRAVQHPFDAQAFQEEAEELKGKFLAKTYRRWERGSALVVGGGLHLAEEVTRVASLGKFGDTPAEWARMYHQVLGRPEMQPVIENWVDKYLGGAIETGPFLGAALAPAALTGGATIPSTVSGFLVAYGVEGNSAYQASLDRGNSEKESRIRGVATGLINGGIEVAGGSGGKFFKNKQAATKAVVSKLSKIKNITRKGLKNALKEGLLEELPQAAVSQVIGGDVPRKKDGSIDWDATADVLVDSAVMGTVLGGLVDAPISTLQAATRAVRDRATTTKQLREIATEVGIPSKGLSQGALRTRIQEKVQELQQQAQPPTGEAPEAAPATEQVQPTPEAPPSLFEQARPVEPPSEAPTETPEAEAPVGGKQS